MDTNFSPPPHVNPDESSKDDRFRPLFALSPQPAWVYDRETLRFLEVNEAAVRSYGWTREEFLAMTLRDIRPPHALAALDMQVEAARGQQQFTSRSTHRTRAGRQLEVEINSYALEFDGHPARMALVNDVTEREAAAVALAESEEKYRTVIEQLQDVFFRTDASGLWTFLNEAWTAVTGNPVDTTLGTHYLSYVHPSDRAVLLDAFRPLSEGSLETTTVEVRYFQRSGGYRWVEASMHAVFDDNGHFAGSMGTLRDVTERRSANDERQRLATNIRQLLDASGDGIYGLDERGIITFVNRRASEMLGFEPEELIGRPMHEATHHTKRDGAPYPIAECPIMRSVLEGISCETDDEVMWCKDGSSLQVEYAANPVRDRGRLAGAVVNVRDISARRRAELELIVARDAAEAANRAKSDFLARMSHELRTPLNSIIGFANVLLRNKMQSFRDTDLSYLNRISTNGKHLLGLINDILDLSKIEAGRMTLELSNVMLDSLVRETIEEMDSQTKDRSIALRAELPAELRSMETDSARLKQVLINLIGNSLKFTEQGEIVIAVEVDKQGKPTRIIVRDTGIGIPADRLAAIFNVFEQAESTTSRRFGGTGLGLAICRSLCELMGHHLDVESEEGKGTAMIIRLGSTLRTWRRSTPMAIPAVTSTMSIAQLSSASNTVLIVDDDADSRLLLGQLVEDEGYKVLQATTGIEALRMAREHLPTLVILDLRLPKISGFDVLRILKSDEELRSVPVIVVSVIATESRSALTGAAEVLDKPVSREQILPVLRKYLPSLAAR